MVDIALNARPFDVGCGVAIELFFPAEQTLYWEWGGHRQNRDSTVGEVVTVGVGLRWTMVTKKIL